MFRALHSARAGKTPQLFVLALLALLLLATCVPVSAQTEGRVLASEVRWLTPYTVEMLLLLFGAPIAAGVAGVVARVWTLLGLKQTAEHRATVEQVLDRGLDLVRKRYGRSGFVPIEFENSALRLVAEYAVDKGPRALKKFGISQVDDPRLREMIEARMGDLLDPEVRASGATRHRPI